MQVHQAEFSNHSHQARSPHGLLGAARLQQLPARLWNLARAVLQLTGLGSWELTFLTGDFLAWKYEWESTHGV